MRVAIVGAGIAGLTAAWYLRHRCDVSVFEANDYLGGHTQTHLIRADDGDFAIDTGFIVFNDRTYPNFLKLLGELGVEYLPTEMSFGVRNDRSGLEYCGSNLDSLFAQRRNLISPRFLRMVKDIMRFNSEAKHFAVNGDATVTLEQFVQQQRYGAGLVDDYLKPMAAAIWSSPVATIGAYPARSFFQFFRNHGLLDLSNRPQWYVIRGGSSQYVARIAAELGDRVHKNAAVTRIQRDDTGVSLQTIGNPPQQFDRVIMACHSDQALGLLSSPHAQEQQVLRNIAYQENQVVLHRDQRQLPQARRAWASWNYRIRDDNGSLPTLTYDMNRLQGLSSRHRFCVTLNQTDIAEDKIEKQLRYEHPVYTLKTLSAQARWHEIDGVDRVHYCGAYWGHGFHEDGVVSALRVVAKLAP